MENEVTLPMPLLVRSEPEEKSEGDEEHNWHSDIETQLKKIEQNSFQQSQISKNEYLELVEIQKYFKLPVIIISGANSVFSIGLVSYLPQSTVSILNCVLAFICSVIGSIELYLNISRKMEVALTSYQSFYLLSVKIANTLKLERKRRNEIDGGKFLCDCLNEYETLFQANNVNIQGIDDNIVHIEMK